MKFAVLASTNGTDMAILKEYPSPFAEFSLVITNNECGALEKAKAWGIPNQLIPSKGRSREEFEAEVHQTLLEHNIDFIVLIGFMRVISPYLINKWPNKIINIHPSLLPSFPGIHSLKEALDYGCKITGCTLHFVDTGADTGPIILQAPVEIHSLETEASLKKKIQQKEQELICKGINLFAQGKLTVEDRIVRIKW